MVSDKIKTVFCEYLEKKDTNYAIFINAAWGHGKTFYWKNILEPLAKEKGFATVRISLFGVADWRELDKKMRNAILLPSLNSMAESNNKWALLPHAMWEGLMQFTENKLSINIDQIITEVSINAYINDKIVICFDDFERSSMSKKDILGFLNNLIEDKSIKMVILCNSAELKESKEAEYCKSKEKVVRWTFDLEQNTDKIFYELCSSDDICRNLSFKAFLDEHMPFIQKIITYLSVKNLRILKRYLDALNRIFPSIYSEENNPLIKEILYYLFASTNECCIGALTKDNLENFKSLREYVTREEAFDILSSDSEKKENGKSKISKWRKYLDFTDVNFIVYPSLSEYLLTGFLDEQKFKKEVESRREVYNDRVNILFNKLTRAEFRFIPDEEFKNDMNEFINYIRDGKYGVYEYPMIAYWLAVYDKLKFINCGNGELNNIISEGLERSKAHFSPNRQRFKYIMDQYSDSNNSFELIKFAKEKVKAIHEEAFNDEAKRDLEKIYELLSSDGNPRDVVGEAIDMIRKNGHLLNEIDVEELMKSLIQAPNGNIFLFNAYLGNLIEELQKLGFYKYLLSFLRSLKTELEKYNPREDYPIANYNIKELLESVDGAIKKLQHS